MTLRASTAAVMLLCAASSCTKTAPPSPFASLDAAMVDLLAKYEIPGGSLAVSRLGRLAYARGYGWADMEPQTPATETSLFRVASVSKVITAVAVMQLYERGKLGLDDKVFGERGLLGNAFGTPLDARLADVTVRHLLQHTGGWNSGLGYDPQYDVVAIARAMGVAAPAGNRDVIAYMVQRQRLDFAPGAEFHYSNFGYNVLGRVIEKVSGQPYADHVASNVFAPAGIARMRLAGNLLAQRVEDEVRYYDSAWDLAESIDGSGAQVPTSYGGLSFATMDAHGGWIGTPTDLLRFLRGVDDRADPPRLLQKDTVAVMRETPAEVPDSHYAMGWVLSAHDRNHSGELQGGTAAFLVLRDDGIGWAVAFNHLPESQSDLGRTGAFFKELKATVSSELDAVTEWPAEDRFSAAK